MFVAHLCSRFVLSGTTCISCLKLCLAVHTQVSAADRSHVVECADGSGDWKALCANLRVNTKTAHGWVKSGAQERRPHAGSRRKALTEEQVDAICGMIEEDQGITLKGKDFG